MSVTKRSASIAITLLVAVLTTVPSTAIGQRVRSASFVSTLGVDTVSFERYERTGNVIVGTWVVRGPGVQVHDYVLVLGRDSMPARFEMFFRAQGVPEPPPLHSVTVEYGRDSTTYITVTDSIATRRVAMTGAYPVLGRSMAGLELALAHLQSLHADSSSIVIHAPTHPENAPATIPVKLFNTDSARLGGAVTARLDAGGRLLGLTGPPGTLSTQRVPTIDVANLIAHFIAADAAAPVRTAIDLPASALQRFVGRYQLGQITLAVALTDNALTLQSTDQQPPLRLFAEAPMKFFIKGANAQVEFETDAEGKVAGLVIVQSGTRQRAIKIK